MSRWYGLSLGLVVAVAIPAPTTGAEFQDPSGFSFQFPDNWIAVTEENRESVPAEVQQLLKDGSVDLSRINVVVVAAGVSDLAPNVSVATLPICLPINQESKQKLMDAVQKRLAASGTRIKGLRGEAYRDGVREAIVLDFDSEKPQSSLLFRQRQVYFTGGENTFVVTFTAAAEQFEEVRSQFYMIQTSFRVPPLSALGWWRMNGATVLGATVVGSVIVFLRWTRRRASRASAPAPLAVESDDAAASAGSSPN